MKGCCLKGVLPAAALGEGDSNAPRVGSSPLAAGLGAGAGCGLLRVRGLAAGLRASSSAHCMLGPVLGEGGRKKRRPGLGPGPRTHRWCIIQQHTCNLCPLRNHRHPNKSNFLNGGVTPPGSEDAVRVRAEDAFQGAKGTCPLQHRCRGTLLPKGAGSWRLPRAPGVPRAESGLRPAPGQAGPEGDPGGGGGPHHRGLAVTPRESPPGCAGPRAASTPVPCPAPALPEGSTPRPSPLAG